MAILSGADEVPANDSRSRGNARFQLSPDGQSFTYQLNVANLEDLHMSHIHREVEGKNGPIIVWLYPESGPPPDTIFGRTSGVLATGVITAANFVGPLAGAPFSELLRLMNVDSAYVNVHTVELPAGEIRGQVKPGG